MTGRICNNVLMGMLLLQRTIVPPTGAAVHGRRLDETMRVWDSDDWSSGLCAAHRRSDGWAQRSAESGVEVCGVWGDFWGIRVPFGVSEGHFQPSPKTSEPRPD